MWVRWSTSFASKVVDGFRRAQCGGARDINNNSKAIISFYELNYKLLTCRGGAATPLLPLKMGSPEKGPPEYSMLIIACIDAEA